MKFINIICYKDNRSIVEQSDFFVKQDYPENFGFYSKSSHTGRTVMLSEFMTVMDNAPGFNDKEILKKIFVEDNLLKKESNSGRKISFYYLKHLYGLDSENKNFQGLLKYWKEKSPDNKIMALLCALSRDEVLRLSSGYILSVKTGDFAEKSGLKEIIDNYYQNIYSEKVRESMVRNLMSSWTQSGYLEGRSNKIRIKPEVSVHSFAYACYLAYLSGFRGKRIFHSPWVLVLCLNDSEAEELTKESNRKGLMSVKKAGSVVEVTFPEDLIGGTQ
ncbi:hypothetical protein [Methanoplanus endosymbiosus]|uniref:Uncharacterized protein n=1 Tax=Methanoplanus endosymbiosus TaxID=33865 RepID=A0A9E7PP54_9EURY|nr:hypothetical protein [Methanoplanus endosymbiosus]UUX92484.1 hypothetical protein L6E24_14310 [Methanoplanus endosymbiosus]